MGGSGNSIETINRSALTSLFGFGYRMSGAVIAPQLAEVASVLSPAYLERVLRKDWDNVAVEGMAALILDTGLLGLLLVVLLPLVLVHRVWHSGAENRLVLIGATLFCFLWLFVIDIRDSVLFFVLLMPNGLISSLALSRGSPIGPTSG